MIEDLVAPPRPKTADRELIRRTFERVVAPRVRDRLLADPGGVRLDGARQTITVLFASVHEFTYFSEQAAPDVLFEVLNSYLSLAAQEVLKEEGTLDRLGGDGVMALWNAPVPQADHVLRAVRAAAAMDRAVKAHHSLLDHTYHLYFSVGLASGQAVLGTVGAPERFTYTAVGDTVDLARHLQTLARPGQILLARETFGAVADRIIARELIPQQPEPPLTPVTAYELLSDVL